MYQKVRAQGRATPACGASRSLSRCFFSIAPVSGTVCAVNADLQDAPETMNKSPYDAWIIEVENVGEKEELMDAAAYEKFCAEEA